MIYHVGGICSRAHGLHLVLYSQVRPSGPLTVMLAVVPPPSEVMRAMDMTSTPLSVHPNPLIEGSVLMDAQPMTGHRLTPPEML